MTKSTKTKADELAATFAEFLEHNPMSKLEKNGGKDDEPSVIIEPWGDDSLSFRIPENPTELAEALNTLYLPQRLSAVYHRDLRKLEVLWTAYQLPEDQKEIFGREFFFTKDGIKHKCHFSRSSDRLLVLAKNVKPMKLSFTSFRNIQSFDHYAKALEGKISVKSLGDPISFWIENIAFDDDDTIALINNLNFYLTYYDNQSPVVMIHSIGEDKSPHPRCRYVKGVFPKNVAARDLDSNLMSFWIAAAAGDAARKFLYYYRIIEYASFFHLEGSARLAVRRILSAPDAIDDIAGVTDKLMSAFQMSKMDEYARFSQIIADTVDPKLLWQEIKGNVGAFSKETKFDGGFSLRPLIAATTKESTFLPKGVENFTKAIRDIRNALSHGRDHKTSTVITPTSRNLKALQPWVHLIAAAAGEVVLYKDVA